MKTRSESENFLCKIRKILGIELSPVSHNERLASALGGFVGILGIFLLSQWLAGSPGAEILVASMGASAVLLFAVPHGKLSQPWALFGGHMVSAVVGVSCAQLVIHEVLSVTLAASLAVGFSIGAMYYLRCIHPPGGATALSAVIGGEQVLSLGYQFVFVPVLLNVLIILSIAFLFNYLFPWRRYPAYLQHVKKQPAVFSHDTDEGEVSHGDFVYALSQLDSFIDVSEYDLLRIYELATSHSRNLRLSPENIIAGKYFSNGEYGDSWSVRQIIETSNNADPNEDTVVYKVLAGQGRRTSGTMSRTEFAHWARYEVLRDDENWKRVIE